MNTDSKKSVIRVLIVDDHFMTRIGLALPIEQEDDMTVVAEVGTVDSAISAFREFVPDVTIMDYRLPDGNGPDAVEAIREEYPGARVLMLSAVEKEEPIYRAVRSGVCGYLNKDSSCSEVLDAVRCIHQGKTIFPPMVAAKIENRSLRPELTKREKSILKEVVAGRSNKEIADSLHLSESTIKQELGRVLKKLKVPDRTRAATLAIELGIFEQH